MGLNIVKQITLVAFVAVLAMGCSKKDGGGGTPPPTNNTPNPGDGGNGGTGTVTSGAVADLQIVSHATLEDYAGRRISTPSNIKVHLDVFDVTQGSSQYGGNLKISYVENGRTVTGTFSSGTSNHDTRYNKWVTTGGVQKLKLMFQDRLGAIVVIIDNQVNDLGLWRGEIYYRNFDFGVCANPPFYGAPICNVQSTLKCWNITAGPYDCRSFMSGDSMRPDLIDLPGYGSSYRHQGTTYPRKGFQKLGTFTNLDLANALNE